MADAGILAIFRILASEFATTSDSDVNDMIDIKILSLYAPHFGARMSEAVALLCAHEFALLAAVAAAGGSGAGGVGPITSKRAGDLAIGWGGISYSAGSNEDAAYQQTRHGLAFLVIRDSRANVGMGLLT